MSQLTEISIFTRKFLVWLAIAFVGYIILKFMIDLGIAYWKATHPIPIPPPNAKYGKLPNPKFTQVATSSSGLNFKLENVDNRPPETTNAGKVYVMPKKFPTLMAAQRARTFAIKLGFTEPESALTPTYYHFVDPEDKYRTLEIDTTTMNLKLKYNFLANPNAIGDEPIQSKEKVIEEVKNFISFQNLFDETVLKGKITTELIYFDREEKVATAATSLSNTNLVRVNFFRGDIDNLKVLPPAFKYSYNYAFYTPSPIINAKVLELYYTFWPIDFDDFGTYPLRSGASAWQDLVDGYALVVNMGNNTPDKIVIRNIYLAYYDSEEPQSYLQPIFVFEGDNDFAAYMPAILNDWLE